MVKTRSMTRNRRNTFKTCENSDVIPWSDLNQDVLSLVMMKLGVIDFVSFSGVCKSWRSLALPNRKMFMASRLPMWTFSHAYKKKYYCCYLDDFEGRRFKTLIPHSGGKRSCVGLTCGYLVFYVVKTFLPDFWLVNPITRHELHFPAFYPGIPDVRKIRSILVFSPSIPGWVFVMINRCNRDIWFSIAGKGVWNHVSCNDSFLDLHAFKGKIYTLTTGGHLYELRLNPKPNLSILEFKDFWEQHIYFQEFVSLGENLYVIDTYRNPRILYEVDFGKMKRVSPEEKTIGEYAIFRSDQRHCAAINPESCAVDLRSKYKSYDCFHGATNDTKKVRFFNADMWYFPHCCLDVDPIDE